MSITFFIIAPFFPRLSLFFSLSTLRCYYVLLGSFCAFIDGGGLDPFPRMGQSLWKIVPLAIVWFLWLEMNHNIFDKKVTRRGIVIERMKSNIIQWTMHIVNMKIFWRLLGKILLVLDFAAFFF